MRYLILNPVTFDGHLAQESNFVDCYLKQQKTMLVIVQKFVFDLFQEVFVDVVHHSLIQKLKVDWRFDSDWVFAEHCAVSFSKEVVLENEIFSTVISIVRW